MSEFLIEKESQVAPLKFPLYRYFNRDVKVMSDACLEKEIRALKLLFSTK